MNPRDIKRRAKDIRKSLIEGATHYYDRKYKDLRVADLLLVLEDDNFHYEETVLEALATLDYCKIVRACKLEVEHHMVDDLSYDDPDRAIRSEDIYKRRKELDDEIRKGK